MTQEQMEHFAKTLFELYAEQENLEVKKIVLNEAPLDLNPSKN